jgi:hypothetical protein
MKKLIVIVFLFIVSQFMIFFWALAPTEALAETDSRMLLISSVLGYMSGYPAHFIAFFVTTLLLSMILVHINFKQPYLISFLYSLFVSLLIELLQKYLTTYRSFDVLDMVSGGVGAGSWVFLIKLSKKR